MDEGVRNSCQRGVLSQSAGGQHAQDIPGGGVEIHVAADFDQLALAQGDLWRARAADVEQV